jgi:hypothetical protein
VNLSIDVGHGMIDDLVRVFAGESFVREQRIGVQRGASIDVLSYFALQSLLFSAVDNDGSNFSCRAPRFPSPQFCLCLQSR